MLTSVSAVYVAFARTAVPHPTQYAWMAPRLWLFGVALFATGIADHRLLTRVMNVSGRLAAAESTSSTN